MIVISNQSQSQKSVAVRRGSGEVRASVLLRKRPGSLEPCPIPSKDKGATFLGEL